MFSMECSTVNRRDMKADAGGQTKIEASEMWTWMRMERISQMDNVSDVSE